jgi:anti-sigma regulatory factor (Ser/Thr protein kinase)
METRLELTETAVPANVRRIRHKVAEVASDAGASRTVVDEIALCVSEAVANVATHAYDDAGGPVDVRVEADDDILKVVVRDRGRGLEHPPSPTDGFGLTIIRTLSRDVSISSSPGRGTELRLRFPLGAPRQRSSRAA